MSGPRRLGWVVERDDTSLHAVLERLGPPAKDALADGRVFVDGRRASVASATLRAGTRVEVTVARPAGEEALRVIESRDGIVAAYKPSALPTEPDRAGRTSARLLVSRRLGIKEDRLHALSRLDVGVSGVVLFALTRAARQRVLAARGAGMLVRRYVAIAQGAPTPPAGEWTAPVGSRPARTRYAVVASAGRVTPGDPRPATLLALAPATGRTHQLRVHAAGAGAPLVGDRAHGGTLRLCAADGSISEVGRIALHAAWVELRDAGGAWRAAADPPPDLLAIWTALGGEPGSWSRAVHEAGFDADVG